MPRYWSSEMSSWDKIHPLDTVVFNFNLKFFLYLEIHGLLLDTRNILNGKSWVPGFCSIHCELHKE